MLAGDLEAAEAELRRDFDALERMGETNYISTTAAFLAEVLYRQGDLDGAEEHTRSAKSSRAGRRVVAVPLGSVRGRSSPRAATRPRARSSRARRWR